MNERMPARRSVRTSLKRTAGAIALLPLLAGATTRTAEVGPVRFEYLALSSDSIVVGRISRVLELPRLPADIEHNRAAMRVAGIEEGGFSDWRLRSEVRIAEIEVQRALVAGAPPARVYYLAEGTWTCDISDATVGERALFFLGRSPALAQESPDFLARAASAGAAGPLHVLEHSGRGRMPLRTVAGREYATVWTGDVQLPAGLETIEGPEPEYSSFIRSAPLDELTSAIESIRARFGKSVPRHPVTGQPAFASLVVDGWAPGPGSPPGPPRVVAALWLDGTAIWSDDLARGGAPYRRADVEHIGFGFEYWSDPLDAAVHEALIGDRFELDPGSRGPCVSILALRLPDFCTALRRAGVEPEGGGAPALREGEPVTFESAWVHLRSHLFARIPADGTPLGDVEFVLD